MKKSLPTVNIEENRITLVPKAIVLLALGFGIKLFFSCTPYSSDLIGINYNNIGVFGAENSDRYLDFNTAPDTMYSNAVALKLTLSDTSEVYAASFFTNLQQMCAFPAVKADGSAPCYIPKNKVVDIKVKTLIDINDFIKAGDDISNHILCASAEDHYLYHNLEHGMLWLNGIQIYSESSSIIMVLKTAVKNTHAQFEVKVSFDNGTELLGTSIIFTVLES